MNINDEFLIPTVSTGIEHSNLIRAKIVEIHKKLHYAHDLIIFQTISGYKICLQKYEVSKLQKIKGREECKKKKEGLEEAFARIEG